MSILLILGNSGLFLAFVARHVHPAVVAFGILFTLAAFIMLMLTTFTEAGIVPRKRLEDYPAPSPSAPPTSPLNANSWGQGNPGNNGPLYPAPTGHMDGVEVPLKW